MPYFFWGGPAIMRVSASRAFPGTFNPRATRGSSVCDKRAAATFVNYITDRMEHSPSRVSKVLRISRNSQHLMEPQGSVTHSEEPATSPYPEPRQSSSCSHSSFLWRSILILFSHLRLGLLFHSSFRTKNLYAPVLCPIRATCLVLLILDLITRIFRSE